MQQARPKVLLLHGIWAGAWIWKDWVPALEQASFEAIAPTLSELMQKTGRSPRLRDYVARLVEQFPLGEDDFVIGHSGGAMIALEYAQTVSHLAGMTLLCPAPPRGARPVASLRALRFAPAVLRGLLRRRWVRPVAPAIYALGMNHVPEGERQALCALLEWMREQREPSAG